MGQETTYFSPTTPGNPSWSEDLSDNVRLGTEDGFVAEAEGAAVGVSNLVLDDPDGTLGHAGDAIEGLKQLYVDELAASAGDQRLWTGYTGRRTYRRGSAERPSLILGAAREIDVELVDVNSFLSFRVFLPTSIDATSSFDRPAETDVERIAALFTVDFLSDTLYDLGLVASTGGLAMDACNYEGQRPADVINDCMQASGRNAFVKYNESANKYELFYDFDYSPVYDSSLRLTNILSEVDNSTTFAVESDWELERDPTRICSGILGRGKDGLTSYRKESDVGLTTSYIHGWRDMVADFPNVSTLGKLNARLDRMLRDNAEDAERLTGTVLLPASAVTGIKQGQRILVHLSHLPGMEGDFRWCRIVHLTDIQRQATAEFYEVRIEAVPLPGVTACAYPAYVASGDPAFVQYATNGGFYGSPMVATFSSPPTPGNLLVASFMAGQATPGEAIDIRVPTCWTIDVEADPSGVTDSRLPNVIVAHHVVLPGDPDTVTFHGDTVIAGPDTHGGCLIVAEYSGLGSAPAVDLVSDSGLLYVPSGPSFTPTAGQKALIFATVGQEPDHPILTATGGFNLRHMIQTMGGSRQTLGLLDRIVASTSGSYSATWTTDVATPGDFAAWAPLVVFKATS